MFQADFIEDIKREMLFSVFFFKRVVYEIMWKNIAEGSFSQITI